MLATQKQAIEAYQRARDFLDDHPPPAEWQRSRGYRAQKRAFDEVVARLSEHAASQIAGRRLRAAEVARQRALRQALREEHLWPISRIARAKLSGAPGIERALTLPGYRISATRLISEAGAVRRAAELYEEQFIEAGRREDFLARLDDAIEAVRQSVLGKARNLGRQVGGTAGLELEIRRGRQVLDILDTIVRDAFGGNEELLAKWRLAKRVREVPGGRGGSDAAEETPAAAA